MERYEKRNSLSNNRAIKKHVSVYIFKIEGQNKLLNVLNLQWRSKFYFFSFIFPYNSINYLLHYISFCLSMRILQMRTNASNQASELSFFFFEKLYPSILPKKSLLPFWSRLAQNFRPNSCARGKKHGDAVTKQ